MGNRCVRRNAGPAASASERALVDRSVVSVDDLAEAEAVLLDGAA